MKALVLMTALLIGFATVDAESRRNSDVTAMDPTVVDVYPANGSYPDDSVLADRGADSLRFEALWCRTGKLSNGRTCAVILQVGVRADGRGVYESKLASRVDHELLTEFWNRGRVGTPDRDAGSR